jgi:hypothetical protein
MAQKTVILRDAPNEKILIKRVTASTGADVAAAGKVDIALPDTQGTDEVYHEVKLRQVTVCIQGNSRAAIVLMSEDFDPTAP